MDKKKEGDQLIKKYLYILLLTDFFSYSVYAANTPLLNSAATQFISASKISNKPVFFVFNTIRFKPGQEPGKGFFDELKSKCRVEKAKEVDSGYGPRIEIPKDLIPDSFIPHLEQKLLVFYSRGGQAVCSSVVDKVKGFYLEDGIAEGSINFETEGSEKEPLYVLVRPSIKNIRVLSQTSLPSNQLEAILKEGSTLFKQHKGWDDEEITFKSFKVDKSFQLNEKPVKVVQLNNPGKDVLCLIKIGNDLILEEEGRILKIISLNDKLYFLFGLRGHYSYTQSVFELDGSKLTQVYSESIGTD